jgi:hypothetical protein
MAGRLTVAVIFYAIPLAGDTCLAPKNPVSADVVCGHVQDPAGEFVPNVDLQLVSNQTVIAEVVTDPKGNFVFGPLPKGEYDLTTTSDGWHLFWPVKVTASKSTQVCKRPLYVRLGIKVCGQLVSKKGYHPRFGE